MLGATKETQTFSHLFVQARAVYLSTCVCGGVYIGVYIYIGMNLAEGYFTRFLMCRNRIHNAWVLSLSSFAFVRTIYTAHEHRYSFRRVSACRLMSPEKLWGFSHFDYAFPLYPVCVPQHARTVYAADTRLQGVRSSGIFFFCRWFRIIFFSKLCSKSEAPSTI